MIDKGMTCLEKAVEDDVYQSLGLLELLSLFSLYFLVSYVSSRKSSLEYESIFTKLFL